jgi:hypothetical protein
MARPRFKPADEQRKTVQVMAAYGIPEEQIARTLGVRGIDPKTLRKYFPRELSVGGTLANSAVAQTLYQMATSGKCAAATIFWLKSRARWTERAPLARPEVADERPESESEAELDQRITAELAGIAARSVEVVSGELEFPAEAQAAPQVEGLESAA